MILRHPFTLSEIHFNRVKHIKKQTREKSILTLSLNIPNYAGTTLIQRLVSAGKSL